MRPTQIRVLMMRKSILIFFVCFSSCIQQQSKHVEIYGVSFDCPSGWKVSETEDYETAKFISIEKKGLTASGLVTMTFTEEDFELDDFLQLLQDSFKEQHVLSNIVFQKSVETNYGEYKGIGASYTFSISGVKHEGKIHVFQQNGITMGIVHQEAIEDHKENLPGFETIMKSVSID